MANRYWVGGTGTWNTTSTTNWSASSGGASGASVPTSADSVFFDQATTYTVTLGTGATLNCLDFTVSAGTVTFSGGFGGLNVYGNFSITAPTIWSATGVIGFGATTTGKTITTNGVSIASSMTFNGSGGYWTLVGALSCLSISVVNGSFDTNSYALTTTQQSTFQISMANSASAVLFLRASTVTLTGATCFSISTLSNFNANTSNIICSYAGANNITFSATGRTLYDISFTASSTTGATLTIGQVRNLSFTPPASAGVKTILFGSNFTSTGTLTASGASQIRRLFFRSSSPGTARTITLPAARTISYADFNDITASGFSITATTSGGDCGNNTNITFPVAKTVYWNLAGAQNWSSTGWATTPTGTPALANFPLAQDTATFTNSGSVTGTITINSSWNIGTVDMSGRTSAMTLSSTSSFSVYGSWLNGTGTTLSGTSTISFSGPSNTQEINGNGRTFTQSINISNIGGIVLLTSAVTTTSTAIVSLVNGNLNLQSYTLTCGTFNSSSSNNREITFSTGNITLLGVGTVWNTAVTSNLVTTGTQVVNVANSTATAATISPGSLSESNSISFNFTAGTYALTMTANSTWRDLDFTGFNGTLVNVAQTVYGSLTLSKSFTGASNTWTFAATSGANTITSNGFTIDWPLTFNGVGGVWTLQDAMAMGSTRTLTHTNGTIDLNGKTLTVGSSYTTGTGTKNLTFNGGTLICPSNSTSFNNADPTGFTTTAGTAIGLISMTSISAKTFVGGGSTFNCILNQGGIGALTITGSNTFSNVTNTVQPATITFTSGSTTTLTDGFNLSGIFGSLITINSSSAGSAATLSLASGTVSCNYLSIRDSTATGGATWYAGASSTDISNNTGWLFSSPQLLNTGNFFAVF